MTTPSGLPEKAPTIRQMRFGVAASRMQLVALDMHRLAHGLSETMPGKMDALVIKLDTWTQAVTDAERYYGRSRPMTTDGLPTGSERETVEEARCHLARQVAYWADELREGYVKINAEIAKILLAALSVKREPDALCYTTQWARFLHDWGDMTVRPYDPAKCVGDGPPWPVWIGSPPSSLAASPPEASEEPTVDFDLDLVRKPDGTLEWEDETTRPVPPVEPEPVGERIAQITAHRACCGSEHDPSQGKLHGYCVVCGVPWPCAYAGTPPAAPREEKPK